MTTLALIVQGHTLMNEGRPFRLVDLAGLDCDRCQSGQPDMSVREGHALCSCGTRSPHLDSDAKRKVWHREHKEQVQAARNGDLHVCPRKATPRALEIRRLTRKIGRAEKIAPEMREDFEALGTHLTQIHIHRLCPVCGHDLDPTRGTTI